MQQTREGNDAEQPHAKAREVRHAEKHRQQRDGRAEIRLLRDEQERDDGEDATNHQVAGVAGAAAILAEVHREHERDRDAAEL